MCRSLLFSAGCRYVLSSVLAPLAGWDGNLQAPADSIGASGVLQRAEAESGGFEQPGKVKAAKGALTAARGCGFGEKPELGSPGSCPGTG